MPGVASFASPWVFEGFVLEALRRETGEGSVLEEPGLVGGYEVRHVSSLPPMAMQPQAALHGVDHPFATRDEFAVWWCLDAAFDHPAKATGRRPRRLESPVQPARRRRKTSSTDVGTTRDASPSQTSRSW